MALITVTNAQLDAGAHANTQHYANARHRGARHHDAGAANEHAAAQPDGHYGAGDSHHHSARA